MTPSTPLLRRCSLQPKPGKRRGLLGDRFSGSICHTVVSSSLGKRTDPQSWGPFSGLRPEVGWSRGSEVVILNPLIVASDLVCS